MRLRPPKPYKTWTEFETEVINSGVHDEHGVPMAIPEDWGEWRPWPDQPTHPKTLADHLAVDPVTGEPPF